MGTPRSWAGFCLPYATRSSNAKACNDMPLTAKTLRVLTSQAMVARSDRTSVAVPKGVVKKAKELSSLASRNGWAALGIDRDDPPTLTAVFEAAIDALLARAKPKGHK